MSGLNRYFLMFASMYACIIAYFIMNGYSFGPKPLPVTQTIDGALLVPGLGSVGALRGSPVTSAAAPSVVSPPVQQPKPEPVESQEEEVVEDTSGITDIVNNVVKCRTTHGDLIVDVRPSWAPEGSRRFVELVEAGHFTNLPFYRVCPKYLTQFGHRYYDSESYDPSDLEPIKDDPSLYRIRDMDFGYFFFTANQANERKSEMAISFCEMDNCDVTALGHKAWEVPVASVRHGYFDTLLKIMETGKPYPKLEVGSMEGKGPDLDKLENDRDYLKTAFPDMAYFEWCKVVQKDTKVRRSVATDHPTSVQKKRKKSDILVGKHAAVKPVHAADTISADADKSAKEDKAIPPSIDDDDTESKTLEEYLKGGDTRDQLLDGRDAMSIVRKEGIQQQQQQPDTKASQPAKADAKPKSAVLPSGLTGEKPFHVKFELRDGSGGALGDVVVKIHPEWAPLGTKRFMDLVAAQFFDNCRFFRSIKGFVAQFGIPAEPLATSHPWARLPIPDDKVATTNARGTLSFASSGKNSRSNQLFFNIHSNGYLDKEGFAPIGEIMEGVELLDKIYTGYGDKPNQGRGTREGNEYFAKEFPELTYMESVRLIE